MNAETWLQVKGVVQNVLDLEPARRQAFLEGLGLTDEIRSEVESLVSFETEAEGMMEMSALAFSKNILESDGDLAGQLVGPYRIIRELGHGGMGAVYLAERSDGKFEQKAALKLLKREMNSTALRRYFDQEREILASLEHPNIARLLDAGTTEDRVPFIAMEYVDGQPIDKYCEKAGSDLRARLELFRTVCSAVDFAHRNLVVHRDLKPSNILVTKDGTPKLLDFGISKILSNEYPQVNSATITRMGVMTPSYASPEQLSKQSVTTQSDVYSLGVILYELLSGHRPFESKESDIRDIYNAVLESDPKPPSVIVTSRSAERRVRSSAPTAVRSSDSYDDAKVETGANEVRNTLGPTASISPQLLRGDLDNIVLKALRKEPERRYSSVQQLSDDIDRHLQGLTVTARPNTFAYRAGKFINRNRLGVSGSALILLAMLIGIGTTLWQARVAQAERAKAEIRFNEVRTLANSFLFEFSPLIEDLPGATPALELLVTRALTYLDSLAKESTDDPTLLRELATAYEKVGDIQGNPNKPTIGDVNGALESYEKSRAIRASLAMNSPDDAALESDLASVLGSIGEIEMNGGDYSKAKGSFEQALVLRQKVVAQSPNDVDARNALAKLFRTIGVAWIYDNDNKKAIEYYSQAQQILRELNAERPEDDKIASEYAYSFVLIGEAQGWDGELDAAAENLDKGLNLTLPIATANPNDQSFQRDQMFALNKRAENFIDRKEEAKAVELYEQSLAVTQQMLKADPQDQRARRDVAITSKKLAQALDSASRSRESLEKLSVTLEMFQQIRSTDPNNTEADYDVANTRFAIGETLMSLKDWRAAISSFETAATDFDRALEINPESTFAARMSAHNRERLGKCYSVLALNADRDRNLRNALNHFEGSLASFTKMKADGKLGDLDLPLLESLPKNIAAIKADLD